MSQQLNKPLPMDIYRNSHEGLGSPSFTAQTTFNVQYVFFYVFMYLLTCSFVIVVILHMLPPSVFYYIGEIKLLNLRHSRTSVLFCLSASIVNVKSILFSCFVSINNMLSDATLCGIPNRTTPVIVCCKRPLHGTGVQDGELVVAW